MKSKPTTGTLDLFEETKTLPPVFEEQATDYAGLKWSFSKQGVLKQCPRRFYYQYYGGNVRQAREEADKEVLRRLKLLVNREERAGQLLHLAIATYFRKAQQGVPITDDGIVRWALRIFRSDMEFSQQGWEQCDLSTDAKAPRFLMEYLHEAEPEVLCIEAAAEMADALERFLMSPLFAGGRELGKTVGTAIEKKFTRLACLPFDVEGQVDLAHQSEANEITLVDWKSGNDTEEGEDSLQLAVYALWARETFDCLPAAITAQKAFLGSENLVTYPLSEKKLASARLAILQDADCFVRMHSYGAEGTVEAFSPCVQEAVCRRCPFVTVCREGKECVS